MRYYITYPEANKPENNYCIITVKPVDEASFLAERGHEVVASGNSLMEALLALEQWKADQEGQ